MFERALLWICFSSSFMRLIKMGSFAVNGMFLAVGTCVNSILGILKHSLFLVLTAV
jgi:hypothetical protein